MGAVVVAGLILAATSPVCPRLPHKAGTGVDGQPAPEPAPARGGPGAMDRLSILWAANPFVRPSWRSGQGRTGTSGTPEAPPQQIRDVRITNVRDNSFSVSWLTTFSTTGEIHHGTDPDSLTNVQPDDRGAATSDDIHHVTVSDLLPSTTYYLDVVSSPISDTNAGAHYSVTTGATLGVPPSPDLSCGQVTKRDGTNPADGALVYVTLVKAGSGERSAPMSALVDSGYWWANLANSRTADLSAYFSYDPNGGDSVELVAEGAFDGRATQAVDTAADSPAAPMTLDPCILVWDYDCNCQVDLSDLDDILGRWQASTGDPEYDPAYDYDSDERIRAYDLMQVAARLDDVCF